MNYSTGALMLDAVTTRMCVCARALPLRLRRSHSVSFQSILKAYKCFKLAFEQLIAARLFNIGVLTFTQNDEKLSYYTAHHIKLCILGSRCLTLFV